ncbi:hypothetical protein, partial [Streptomyces sp. H27-H5]|uniref:hypothetical protein n=1 Tax=Streptomyces sp. H27-H5 TaxID=2996460 RepID=UPI00226FF2D7
GGPPGAAAINTAPASATAVGTPTPTPHHDQPAHQRLSTAAVRDEGNQDGLKTRGEPGNGLCHPVISYPVHLDDVPSQTAMDALEARVAALESHSPVVPEPEHMIITIAPETMAIRMEECNDIHI